MCVCVCIYIYISILNFFFSFHFFNTTNFLYISSKNILSRKTSVFHMSNDLTFNLFDWFIEIFGQIKIFVKRVCFTNL